MCVFRGEEQSMTSGILGKRRDRMQERKGYHAGSGQHWFRKAMKWLK